MKVVHPGDDRFSFPPLDDADEEGLIVIGGKLTPSKILEAYRQGIFPWFNEDDPVLWWSPDPRFVLFPEDLHVSNSMKKVLRKNEFIFKTDTAFEDVMHACATAPRKGEHGTWITNEMKDVYTELHYQGFAHSAETWKKDVLVGGMYGVRIGKVFFAESMFSIESNASKFALVNYVETLQHDGVELVDCQVYSSHVESLGATSIKRKDFVALLQQLIPVN